VDATGMLTASTVATGGLSVTGATQLADVSSTGSLTVAGSATVGGDATITGNVTAANFYGSFVGDGSGLTGVVASTGDRIVSGSTYMIAEQATGLVSLTQNSTNTAYFHPQLGLVTIGVSSTGTISATNLYSSGYLLVGATKPSWFSSGIYSSGYIFTAGNMVVGATGLASNTAGNYYFGDSNLMTGFRGLSISGGNNYIATLISGTEAMRVVSSGYVGIGTPSPSSTLHVVTGSQTDVVTIDTSGTTSNILRVNVNGYYRGALVKNALGGLDLATAAGSNYHINLNPGSGKVGINFINGLNVAPSTTLHVSGTIRMADSGESCDTNRTGAMRYNGGEFYVCRNGTAWESLASIAAGGATVADGLSGSLVFRDQVGVLHGHPTISVSSTTGSVGIGAGAPSWVGGYSLYVSNTIYGLRYLVGDDNAIKWGAGSSYISGNGTTGNYIGFTTSGTEAMRIVSSGNVGIGTANPYGVLHIYNSSGPSLASPTFIVESNNHTSQEFRKSGATKGRIRIDGVGNMVMSPFGGSMIFGQDGAVNEYKFTPSLSLLATRIVSTGQVFVGLAPNIDFAPSTTLHVSGTIRMADGGESCDADRKGAIRYNSNEFYVCRNGTAWESLTSIAQSAAVAADRITSGTTYMIAEQATGLVSITQNGTNTAYFHPQLGLVSIGVSTTGPISAGEIYSAGDIRTRYGSKIYVQGGPLLAVSGSVPVVRSNATNDPSLSFSAGQNSPEAMRIVSSGFVGIGTSNPSSTLHIMGVEGDPRAGLILGSTSGTAAFRGQWMPDGNYSSLIKINTSGRLSIVNMSSGAIAMFDGNTRRVGISIYETPSTSLHVSGTIRMSDGGETCDANRTGAIRYNSGEFYVCRNGTAWESLTSIAQSAAVAADRITSGTTSVLAISSTGLVSITQSGTNTAYFHPQLGLVSIGVSSTGSISATNLYSSGYLLVGAAKPAWLSSGIYAGGGIFTPGNVVVGATGLASNTAGNYYFGDSNLMTGFRGLSISGGNNYIATLISGTEAMRVVSSGYVGIGTANPSSTLHIFGAQNVNGGLTVGDNKQFQVYAHNNYSATLNMPQSGNLFIAAAGTPGFAFYTATRQAILGSNNLPSSTLHVVGAIRLGAETSPTLVTCDVNRVGSIKYETNEFYVCRNGTAWESLTSIAQSAAVAADRITSGTTYVVADGTTGLVSITQSGTNTAYFHPSLGLVTIGVSSTGGIKATGLRAYSPVSGSILGFFRNDADTVDLTIDSSGASTSVRLMGGLGDNLTLGTSNTEILYIKGNGNIGIGTNTARTRLDVKDGSIKLGGEGQFITFNGYYDNATSNWMQSQASTHTGYIRMGMQNVGEGGDIQIGTDANIDPYATGDTSTSIMRRLVIRRAGDVRIASGTYIGSVTVTPTAMLEVAGNISATGLSVNGQPVIGGAADLYTLTHVSASTAGGNLFAGSTAGATAGITNTTAFGIGTLGAGTNTGFGNAAFGSWALNKNTSGYYNTGVGPYALFNNTSGIYNTATGYYALSANTTGNYNTAVGGSVLTNNTTGNTNVGVGIQALAANTTGGSNVAVGGWSLMVNTAGTGNIGVGANTLRWNALGSSNVAVGNSALQFSEQVSSTVAIGSSAGLGVASTTTFINGTFLGTQSGYGITTGNNNTMLGFKSGYNVTSGANNITLGAGTNLLDGTASNQLNIGNAIYGDLALKRIGLGGITSPTVSLEVSGTISSTLASANVGNFGNVYASGMVSTAALYVNGQPVSGGAGDLYALTHVSASVAGRNLFVGDTTGATAGITDTTAMGMRAFGAGTNTGFANTALGASALSANTSGAFNVGSGFAALTNNTTGGNNSALGAGSLYKNTTGIYNTAVGTWSAYYTTTGQYNTAVGGLSLNKNTTASNNTAIGHNSLGWNTTGGQNFAGGRESLYFADTVINTTALGYQSGYGVASTTTFVNGTFLGFQSGYGITTGSSNTMIGYKSGYNISSGANNITLGAGTNLLDGTASNQLNIGNAIYGDLAMKRIGLGGITSPTVSLEVSGTISSTLTSANVGNFGNVYASGMVSTAALYVNGQPVSGGAGDLYTLSHVSASAIAGNLFAGSTAGATAGITNTTAFGIGALADPANTGWSNAAFGTYALNRNTTGQWNTAFGSLALRNNTSGYYNTAVGKSVLENNTTGYQNTALGIAALSYNVDGSMNVALGVNASNQNTSGSNNTTVGVGAMYKNQTGGANSAFGSGALSNNQANNNTGLGSWALNWNTTGNYNTGVGMSALNYGEIVSNSVGIGYRAGYGVASSTTFQNGTFVGANSGYGITTGNSNTLIGYKAGYNVSSGANNITLGANTNLLDGTASNQLNIGNAIFGDIAMKRIGIGITSPSAPLEVSGSIKISGDGTEGCASAADSGRIRMNPATGRLQVCKWNP
jgi:hypothetical protein